MMMGARGWMWVGLLMAAAAGPAWGQESFGRTRDLFDEHTFAMQAGGAYANFTEAGAKAVTGAGGNWTVRGTWGQARRLGAEVSYLGAVFPVEARGMSDSAVVENGLEALLRLGLPTLPSVNSFLTPYVAAGMGWSAFNLLGADSGNAGRIADSDSVLTVPLGLGVAGGYRRFSADARLMYRPAFGDEMFSAADRSGSSGQDTVGLGASAGYRF
jgi:hypothetical protein